MAKRSQYFEAVIQENLQPDKFLEFTKSRSEFTVKEDSTFIYILYKDTSVRFIKKDKLEYTNDGQKEIAKEILSELFDKNTFRFPKMITMFLEVSCCEGTKIETVRTRNPFKILRKRKDVLRISMK